MDDFQIGLKTFTENTALTYLVANKILLESEDFFNKFTDLQLIHMVRVWLTEAPSFTKLQFLSYLNLRLSGERYTFDEIVVGGLSNLVTLSLSNSYFSGVTKGAFRNLIQLTELDISNNGILYIEDGAFADLIKLKKLSMYGNSLSSVPNDMFEGPSELTYLSSFIPLPISALLHTRKLVEIELYYISSKTILHAYVFQQMNSLTSLYLHGYFSCDCEIQWMSVVSQYGIEIQGSLVCSQPAEFQGTNIYDTAVYSKCSQTETYQCFNKSITCPGNQTCENDNDTCNCSIGYMKNSGNCVDIDECDNETNCQQSCMNTEGSYSCICDKGYQLASNGYDCDDVNECHEGNGGCEHDCVNIIGSYLCYHQDEHLVYNKTHCETNIECDVIHNGNYSENIFVCT